MNAQEREAFYDADVAPVLLELARKCETNGLSFAAMVEWAPEDTGETISLREGAGIKTIMAAFSIRSHGNADSLIGALMRHGKEHGHNSAYLHMLERKV